MSLLFACALAAVVDGDTIRCANIEDANGRVRLARINAPELREPGGQEAKAALQAMLVGEVTCEHVDADPRISGFQERDRFGRVVARCSAGGREFGEVLVAAGHAGQWP